MFQNTKSPTAARAWSSSSRPKGVLRAVEGREEAHAVEGVLDVRIYREPGMSFGPLRRGADRAGAVIAVGDSRDEALARARAAANEIRFVVE